MSRRVVLGIVAAAVVVAAVVVYGVRDEPSDPSPEQSATPTPPPGVVPPDGRMFEPGEYGVTDDGTEVTVSVAEVGRLALASGRIVAGDPVEGFDHQPFTVEVPAGEYPVSVAVVTLDREDQPDRTLHAAARIVLRDEPVDRWEPAVRPGEDPSTLREGEFYGYAVRSGLGAFLDASAVPTLPLDPALGTEPLTRTVVGGQVAVFGSGFGSGRYPTWIGRDADDRVAVVLTDFLVIPPELRARS